MNGDVNIKRYLKQGRRLLVPTITAILCFLSTVINPWNKLGGSYAFLPYTSVILFFFPGGRLVSQIEATVLGLLGALFGLTWTAVALAIAMKCGQQYGADGPQARAVLGLALGLLALICGFARSYYPRLLAASRISLFYPIFLLTNNQAIDAWHSDYFTNMFFVVIFSAAFALIPTIFFSHHSSGPELSKNILDALNTTSALLPISLSSILHPAPAPTEPEVNAGDVETPKSVISPHLEQDRLTRQLKKLINTLQPTYDSYTLGVARSTLAPTSLLPLIKTLKRLHRNPLLGTTSHIPGERLQVALDRSYESAMAMSPSMSPSRPGTPKRLDMFRGMSGNAGPSGLSTPVSSKSVPLPSLRHFVVNRQRGFSPSPPPSTPSSPILIHACTSLVDAIAHGLTMMRDTLSSALVYTPSESESRQTESDSLSFARVSLETALSELQNQLSTLLDNLSATHERARISSQSPSDLRRIALEPEGSIERDNFRLAFYMTALLDLAKEVLKLFDAVADIASAAQGPRSWWFPAVRWFWWKNTTDSKVGSPDKVGEDGAQSTGNEMKVEGDENVLDDMDFVNATLHRNQARATGYTTLRGRAGRAWKSLWDRSNVVRARVSLSHFIHHLKHSRHVLYAVKLSGGISLLALPAFLPPGTAGRRWYESTRGPWTVLSYMYVLDLHTGATIMVGTYRLMGTFIGAVAAYICVLIAKDNPYALVVLGTTCSVPIAYCILFTSFPPIGIVAGITLPPVLFLPYLGLDNGQSALTLAWTRFVDITIGIVAAVLVGTLIWPNHARVRYFRGVSSTLEQATSYYLRMSRDNLRPSLVYQANSKQYDHTEAAVRFNLVSCRRLIDIQRKEVSLLPRPIKLYSEIIDASERLIEAFIEIRMLRFSVPRKATVLDVLPLRRELVSAILMNLWAVSQAFISRSPLPQFLPSPRLALEAVMIAVDEYAKANRRTNTPREGGGHELAILYGMAENEALGEVCNIVDELVAATRTLFGSQTFLNTRLAEYRGHADML